MSGLVGCTRSREIWRVSARPVAVHVLPPSVVLNTPSPCDTLSLTGVQALPPSVVLKTPPPVVPIQYSLGRLADPATAMLRPPRKMPISRQLRAAKTSVSKDLGAAWARAAGTATSAAPRARTQARVRVSTVQPSGAWKETGAL